MPCAASARIIALCSHTLAALVAPFLNYGGWIIPQFRVGSIVDLRGVVVQQAVPQHCFCFLVLPSARSEANIGSHAANPGSLYQYLISLRRCNHTRPRTPAGKWPPVHAFSQYSFPRPYQQYQQPLPSPLAPPLVQHIHPNVTRRLNAYTH